MDNPGGLPGSAGTYQYGVTPGQGANTEDLRGARRRRIKSRDLPVITNTDGKKVPKLVRKPRRRDGVNR